jgi:DHA2 family methylenomycin A resistance protein-like MFS transporter
MPWSRRRRLSLVTCGLAYFVVILATTSVGVALKRIEADLGADLAGLQWVVDGYNLAFAALLLTGGGVADRFGGSRVLAAGFGVFAGASALSAAAANLWWLAGLQAVAGAGAALLLPASLSVLTETFGVDEGRAPAVAIWGAIGGAAIPAGPLTGGLLVQALGWRSIFALDFCLAAAALALGLRCVRPSPTSRAGLDVPGQLAVLVGLGSLTFALIESGVLGWGAPATLGSLALFALAAVVFLGVESRTPRPALPLGLFRVRAFSGAIAIGLLLNLGFYGQTFVLALAFELVRGYPALLTGLAFLPMTAGVPCGNLAAGRLMGRLSARPVVAAGLVAGAAGLLALAATAAAPFPALAAPLAVIGFGWGLTIPPLTMVLVGSVPASRTGLAGGVFNAARQTGGVIGVGLLGSVVAAGGGALGVGLALAVAGSALVVAAVLATGLLAGGALRPAGAATPHSPTGEEPEVPGSK